MIDNIQNILNIVDNSFVFNPESDLSEQQQRQNFQSSYWRLNNVGSLLFNPDPCEGLNFCFKNIEFPLVQNEENFLQTMKSFKDFSFAPESFKNAILIAEFIKTIISDVTENENEEIFDQLEWLIEKE